MALSFKTNQTKDTEHRNFVFFFKKEQVKNADLYISVMNKIMTTHK